MNPPNERIERPLTLRVFRYDATQGGEPYFQNFTVTARRGMTVLEALFQAQETQDGSLAFRYSCRGAVCGSCGMVINGRLDLACRVQVAKLGSPVVVLEPLPNLTVRRDLVVDMDPFWQAYEKVQPWLHPLPQTPERENLMDERDRERIDQFINCILCACCYGACPVLGRDEDYLGPAALAKLFRFVADTRDDRQGKTLAVADSPQGVWGCDQMFRCCTACPKEVRPTDGITGLRRALVRRRARGGKLRAPDDRFSGQPRSQGR